jgi:hypothetical protein
MDIITNTWVAVEVDDTCSLSCEVVGDQAQFQFGHGGDGSLSLVINEGSLERLARLANEAVERWGAIPEGHEVSFTVTV